MIQTLLSAREFNNAVKAIRCRQEERLLNVPENVKAQAHEIRIRVNKPIEIVCVDTSYFLGKDERVTKYYHMADSLTTKQDIEDIFAQICRHSVYSYQNELKDGYITMRGGCRVGVCGTTVVNDGKICGMKHISSLNIRIQKNISGSSENILKLLGEDILKGTLIAGPPCSGKTTILRDLAYKISLGIEFKKASKVSVIDERGEISGIDGSVSTFDLGLSDVLNGCKKGNGIVMLIRSMAPDVIICDEIGDTNDALGILWGLNAGVSIISTIHAGSVGELIKRPEAKQVLKTSAFKNIVILKGKEYPTEVKEIIDFSEVSL